METTFTVDVETPDAALERAQPRFKVVGTYDYAAFPAAGILLLVRDVVAGGIAIHFLAIGLIVARRGLRPGKPPERNGGA